MFLRVAWTLVLLALPSIASAQEDVASEDVAPELVEAEPVEAEPVEPPGLDFVYSGRLEGLSRGSELFELQERLRPALDQAGVQVERIEVLHGVMAQGDAELWPVDGRVASALAYAAGQPSCDEGELVQTARTPTERFFAMPGTVELPVRDALAEPRRQQRCTAGGVEAMVLTPPDGPGAEALKLDAYDLRTAFRWVAGEGGWMQIGRPRREAGRRLGVIRKALAERPGALYLDAGDFLSPRRDHGDPSWLDGRAISFSMLESLSPAALAPGAAELALGPAALVDEASSRALPYVATNWALPEGAPTLPRFRIVKLETGEGPLSIAFLGVTDPAVVARVPEIAAEQLELLDPVPAVNAAVDELLASDDPPDLIVLLSHAGTDLQARLRGRLRGVDLLLGDPTAATFRVDTTRTTFRDVGGAFKAAPVTLPLDGLATARVTFEDGRPAAVETSPLQIRPDSPADPELTQATTEWNARRDQGLGRPLIPAEEPLAGVSDARWTKLVCEAVLDATGADSVFVSGLPFYRETPGPLTELLVRDRLGGGHTIEVHKVDGDRMKTFLAAARGGAPIQCGASASSPLAHGRFIDPLRTYRVATTDLSRRDGRLGELLARASSDLVGHRPKFGTLRGEAGTLGLTDAVLGSLRAARAEDPSWAAAIQARSPKDVRPLWLFDLRRLSLQLVRFEGVKSDAYGSVPETLLAAPSSFTLGLEADLGFEFSSRHLRADLRFVTAYTRIAVDGLPPLETADDWKLSSSIELPVATFPPRGAFQLIPFVEGQFDSEYTPAETEDGTVLPRQLDLSGFLGLSAARRSWLRSMRLGAFVNRDLGQLDDKSTEFGGRFTGATFHSVLPLAALWITTAWDVQVFGDTPTDDESDLRLRMSGEVRASVRLVRWLRIGLFVRALLVQGRVEATSVPAGTAVFGVALDVAGALRMNAGPKLVR